jgi:hypothetical protein
MVFGDICKLTGQGELKGSTGKFAERRKSVLQWCCINCCAWVAVGVSCCHGVRYALVALRFSQGFRVVQVDQVGCWHTSNRASDRSPQIITASDQDLFHLPVEPDQPCPEYRSLLFLLPQWFTVAVHLKH